MNDDSISISRLNPQIATWFSFMPSRSRGYEYEKFNVQMSVVSFYKKTSQFSLKFLEKIFLKKL